MRAESPSEANLQRKGLSGSATHHILFLRRSYCFSVKMSKIDLYMMIIKEW